MRAVRKRGQDAGYAEEVDEPRLDRILRLLRERGGRVTTARRAIITALLESTGHVTADELAATVQAAQPDVHLSTIYRCLEALEDLGVVDHVHLGHGRAVYHLTDETHQHLFCERCERVQELPIAKLRPLFAMLEQEFAFELDRRHFAIVGRCRECGDPA